MSLRIITGATGTNHVTSQDDGSLNQVLLGSKSVVLDIGNKLSATIVDNNTIRLADGDLLLQGRHARLDAGTTQDVTIGTGAIDYNRNDLIVARYSMSSTTGYEKIEFKVIEGTETSGSATDPTYNTGNIRTGSTLVDFPLYRVRLTGINIAGVDKLFETTGGAGSSLIASGYSATTSYKYGEVCINNGEMWTSLVSNNVGNTPTEGVYWTKSSIANQMGGLKFGIDGDGNGGYYKADGSFSPFSSKSDGVSAFIWGASNNCAYSIKKDTKTAIVISASTYQGSSSVYQRLADGTRTVLSQGTATISKHNIVLFNGLEPNDFIGASSPGGYNGTGITAVVNNATTLLYQWVIGTSQNTANITIPIEAVGKTITVAVTNDSTYNYSISANINNSNAEKTEIVNDGHNLIAEFRKFKKGDIISVTKAGTSGVGGFICAVY